MTGSHLNSIVGFRGKTFADFCAVYYATLVSFGNYWNQLRSGDEIQLQDLPEKAWQYPAAIRLVKIREYIERAIVMSGLTDRVRLGMFSKVWGDLVSRNDFPQHIGFLLDYWMRNFQGEVDLIIAFPYDKRLHHIAYGLNNFKSVLNLPGALDPQGIENKLFDLRSKMRLTVSKQKTVRYISRAHTADNDVHIHFDQRDYALSELSFLFYSPSLAKRICSSLLTEKGDITFEPLCLYESSDGKSFSELNFFHFEILQFKRLEHDTTLHTMQKRVICVDQLGEDHSYIMFFKHAQSLKGSLNIICLVRRAWSRSDAFILSYRQIGEPEAEKLRTITVQNDQEFQRRFGLISIDEIQIPSIEVAQNQFMAGQSLRLISFGEGKVMRIEERDGTRYIHISLQRKKYKEQNTMLTWTESKVMANLES